MYYLVSLIDDDGVPHLVVCKDRGQVANLVDNLDTENYSLTKVDVLGPNVTDNYTEYVKKDENIEFGDKTGDKIGDKIDKVK